MTMTTLGQLCNLLRDCAEKLEEELKTSINDCNNRVISKKMTEVETALEKAKDFHFKEIFNIIADIITSVKKILLHQDKIQKLDNKEHVTDDELKRYSYVRRQISNFSGNTPSPIVTRREIRRAASEASVYSLEAWEQYQDQKEAEEKTLHSLSSMTSATSLPNISITPKLRTQKGKRKQKKFVSSTFNNILDDGLTKSRSLDFLAEDIAEEDASSAESDENILENLDKDEYVGNEMSETRARDTDIEENKKANGYCVTELIKVTADAAAGDTKPRIVDVVYKKKPA